MKIQYNLAYKDQEPCATVLIIITTTILLKIQVAEQVTLTCLLEIPGLNLGMTTDYPDVFVVVLGRSR
jgi:hypothetical protein